MRYNRIEGTGLSLSAVALGTWVFGSDHWNGSDEKLCHDAVLAALSAGVNVIDTAPAYGWGRAEEIVGRAVKGRRQSVIIADKCGLVNKPDGRVDRNLKPESVRAEAERSLKRLGTGYIDIYQLHWPDPDTPLEDTFSELLRLKEEGKIRHIGVCNFGSELLKKAFDCGPVFSAQNQFSLLKREEGLDVLPICREPKTAFFAYGPLSGGILSAKYKSAPALGKSDARRFFYKHYSTGNGAFSAASKTASALAALGKGYGATAAQCAIAWALAHDGVSSVLCGARSPEQALENAGAADFNIPLSAYENI
ncbi:MAG: aldo/keto reductase [Elusimicrobiaceae bacterium]